MNALVSLRRLALLYNLTIDWRIVRPYDSLPGDISSPDVFQVQFRSTEIGTGLILIGAYGDGATQKDAADDYLRQIAHKKLIVNAYGENRREIMVPALGVILT